MASVHEVKRGETIIQIARQYGFRSWQTVWADDQNAGLRVLRPNAHILEKGDKLHIPDKENAEYDCETNRKHVFRIRSMTQTINQVILDSTDQPMPAKKFELKAGGKTYQGETGADGLISQEIPLSATKADLKVWLDDNDASKAQSWTIQLGDLEPVESTYGLKGHLTNLGYDCGTVDDQFDDKTKEALTAFQEEHGLEPTGENDPATQQKLKEITAYSSESGA